MAWQTTVLRPWYHPHNLFERTAYVVLYFALLGAVCGFFYWIDSNEEVPLDAPGWSCMRGEGGESVACIARDGYHFEFDPDGVKMAIHNLPGDQEERQQDLDTARGWYLLDNKERQTILEGHASIYDYVEFK
jgi:hypothetical protein